MKFILKIQLTVLILFLSNILQAQNEEDSVIVVESDTVKTEFFNSITKTSEEIVDSARIIKRINPKKYKPVVRGEKPKDITKENWQILEPHERDSVLQAWDLYDKIYYGKKYKFTKADKVLLTKPYRDLSWREKWKYRRISKKPDKARKAVQKRRIKRLNKVLGYYGNSKSDKEQQAELGGEERIKAYKTRREIAGRKEALRREKVIKKYDNKEARIRKRYTLSLDEKKALNKAKGGAHMNAKERRLYKRARRKQEKFTQKYEKLKKRRWFYLQDKITQKRIKELEKRKKAREKYFGY